MMLFLWEYGVLCLRVTSGYGRVFPNDASVSSKAFEKPLFYIWPLIGCFKK
jgi:hypothetical protein